MKNLKSMELMFPYIEDKGYHLDDDFLDALTDVPGSLSTLIAIYVDEYCPELEVNDLVSHLLAGVVTHFDEQIYFVVEIIRPTTYDIIFTDIKFIDVDEYLDFINLDLYLELDERFNYPGPYKDNK